jgi:hypothetical protein
MMPIESRLKHSQQIIATNISLHTSKTFDKQTRRLIGLVISKTWLKKTWNRQHHRSLGIGSSQRYGKDFSSTQAASGLISITAS